MLTFFGKSGFYLFLDKRLIVNRIAPALVGEKHQQEAGFSPPMTKTSIARSRTIIAH
jgi:hypothetical protein